MAWRGLGKSGLGAVAIAVVALTGCGNFENPLNWDQSPAADALVGSWRAVEGDEAGSRVHVSRTDDGALRFEVHYPEGRPSMEKDKDKHRAKFLADILGSESVDVLQIAASSYKEFDEKGKPLGPNGSGHVFRRVELSPDGGLSVHRLDRNVLGRVAETQLADAGLEIDVGAVSGCLGEEVRLTVWRGLWEGINERLDGELKAEFIAALDEDGNAVDEFERHLAELDDLKVDPYRELARLRTCIARHLPSESLGQVFASHPDMVFSAGVDRYTRE